MQNRRSILERYAAQHRSSLAASEAALWSATRGGRIGVWFRRQVVVGGFIADFVAPRARLVVEVDGPYHARRRAADARRDAKLRRLGYRLLRLDSHLVLHNLPEAVARICAALSEEG